MTVVISTISALAATLGRVAKLQVFAESPSSTAQQKTDFKEAFANALNDIAKAAKSDPKVLESYGQFLERTDTGKRDKDNKPIFEYKKDKDGNEKTLRHKFAVYCDDIAAGANTLEELFELFEALLCCCAKAGIQVKDNKDGTSWS